MPPDEMLKLLSDVKSLAKRYQMLASRPLGVTGEVAEFEAARLLGLEIAPARQSGWDATDRETGRRFQIKGRVLLDGALGGQRLSRLDASKEWDAVLVVLLNSDYESVAIHETSREKVLALLARPGSRARTERGQLGVAEVIRAGKKRWGAATPVRKSDGNPVRYQHTRLCFKADIIDPLDADQYFEVETPHGTFRMTKRQFEMDFANVVRSKSYQEDRIYHYSVLPERASRYLL